MLLVQKWLFFQLYISANIGQKKTRSSKSHKIDIFPKRLAHGFGPKPAILQLFFLGNFSQENVFNDILERVNAFLGFKKKSSKSRKIDIFPKGLTHTFGPKMAIFPTFCFPQYRPGKSLLRYSRTEKTPFQAIRTGSSKSHKIDIFPKGLTHAFNPKIAILERENASLGYKNKKFKKS